MTQASNKLEMGILKIIIARFKSKSPEGYVILARICVVVASIMGAYVLAYNGHGLPSAWEPISGKIDNICIVIGAAFSALGLGAGSTTTDPALVSTEVKANVVQEAVDKGTHMPLDNGNDTNG